MVVLIQHELTIPAQSCQSEYEDQTILQSLLAYNIYSSQISNYLLMTHYVLKSVP